MKNLPVLSILVYTDKLSLFGVMPTWNKCYSLHTTSNVLVVSTLPVVKLYSRILCASLVVIFV